MQMDPEEFVEVDDGGEAAAAPQAEISEGVMASVDQAFAEEDAAASESAAAEATEEAEAAADEKPAE